MKNDIKKEIAQKVKQLLLKKLNASESFFLNVSKMKYMCLDPKTLQNKEYTLLDYYLGVDLDVKLQDPRLFFIPLITFEIDKIKKKNHPTPSSIIGSVKGSIPMVNGSYKYDEDGNVKIEIKDFSVEEYINYQSI